MGDEGAKALAHHLATLTSLQLIDISQAKIDLGTKIKCVRLRKLPFEVAQPARSPCASCSHMTAWKRTRLGPTAFIAGDMSSGCTSPACNMDQYAAPGLSARGGLGHRACRDASVGWFWPHGQPGVARRASEVGGGYTSPQCPFWRAVSATREVTRGRPAVEHMGVCMSALASTHARMRARRSILPRSDRTGRRVCTASVFSKRGHRGASTHLPAEMLAVPHSQPLLQ